jgi:cytoskeletal protein CcmA (bactofilin family)
MMFKKSEDKQDDNEKAARSSEPSFEVRTRSVSVIGPTLIFKGELSANEDLIIEGEIEGKIAHQGKNLTVGKNGKVKANIHAQQIEILGRVDGDIRGDDIVKLAKSAVVHGNIHCARIAMEDGAHFSGAITMDAPQIGQATKKPAIEDKLSIEPKPGKMTSVAG